MGWFLYDRDVHHEIVKYLWEYKEFVEIYQLIVKILETGSFFKKKKIFNNFSPIIYFYAPWKCQKTFGFLTFSGGIEIEH